MKYLLFLLAMVGQLAAAELDLVSTNFTSTTNVFVTAVGPVLRLGGGDVGVTATLLSTSNTANSIILYFQRTVDGTNWGATNSLLSVTAASTGTNPVVTASNLAGVTGFSGIRLAGYLATQTTNLIVTNLTYGTWR